MYKHIIFKLRKMQRRRYFETSLLFASLSYRISNEHAAAPGINCITKIIYEKL